MTNFLQGYLGSTKLTNIHTFDPTDTQKCQINGPKTPQTSDFDIKNFFKNLQQLLTRVTFQSL